MRISSKGRYGLAVLLEMVGGRDEPVSVATIAERLGLSKVYLEQIFSALRKNGLLISLKGNQGGYLLAKEPKEVTVYEILSALDSGLFEKTDTDFLESRLDLKGALEENVFSVLDKKIRETLSSVSLADLNEQVAPPDIMYYI